MDATKASPAATLNIKIGDRDHEVTMFFGRLNELAEVVGAYENLPNIDFHAPTRQAVMDICLAPRDERGRRIEGEGVNLYEMTIGDAEAVLDFARDHLADFFLGRLEHQLRGLTTNADRLTGVGSLLNGLAGSASKTQ